MQQINRQYAGLNHSMTLTSATGGWNYMAADTAAAGWHGRGGFPTRGRGERGRHAGLWTWPKSRAPGG